MSRFSSEASTTLLDCDEGRRLGCGTFCCGLIVRLDPDHEEYTPEGRRKSCVDKDAADGLCVHLDRTTHRCAIFERRPAVCRGYSCNGDKMLQAALETGATSIVELVKARVTTPPHLWRRIPVLAEATDEGGRPE